MGEVVAVIKIMPNGVDVDLEKMKENLAAVVPAGIDLNGIAEEPIAFGLVALMATVVVPLSSVMSRAEPTRSRMRLQRSQVSRACR